MGHRGLPTRLWPAGTCAAGRRRAGRAGTFPAHGRDPPWGSHPRQDPIDALAVARAALREHDLPVAHHDQPSRELKLLVDHRDQLVSRRTEIINRLRWRLHELDPELVVPERTLDRPGTQQRLADALGDPRRVETAAAEGLDLQRQLALDELSEVIGLSDRANDLGKPIRSRSQQQAPELVELTGCGPLTAAKLVAETAGVHRFRNEDCFPAHAGTAPIPDDARRKCARMLSESAQLARR